MGMYNGERRCLLLLLLLTVHVAKSLHGYVSRKLCRWKEQAAVPVHSCEKRGKLIRTSPLMLT